MRPYFTLVSLTLLLAGSAGAFTEEDGWRVAVQAWTFRSSTFFETVDRAAELGVHYLEAYPGQPIGGGIEGTTHYTMDETTRQQLKDKLQKAGVDLVQYGVVGGKDEADWRKLFAFAKDMGIETITSEPPQEQLDLVEKLCDEYGVDLAIHNHPKPSRYWNPNTVLDALKGRSDRMGVCADTGHYVRSGLDSVAVLSKLADRVITVHLKDLAERKPKTHDVVYGTGAGDMNGQLLALKGHDFRGVITIEYEHETPALKDEVAGCLAYLGAWDGSMASSHSDMTTDVRALWADPTEGSSVQWSLEDIVPGRPPEPELALSELERVTDTPEDVRQGLTWDAKPLTMMGETFTQGLGVRAGTTVSYPIPADKQRFVTSASVNTGSVVFLVYGVQEDEEASERVLAGSPTLPSEGVSSWHFDVNLRGRYAQLRLVVESEGEGEASASWINPGFLAVPEK